MVTTTLTVLILAFSLYCFYDKSKMHKYMFYPYAIKHDKEHYRFLTHAFIHADLVHLSLNIFSLLMFGYAVEEIYFYEMFLPDKYDPSYEQSQHAHQMAKLAYIGLFTGGIYAASITEYYRNRFNPTYSSLGASGAIEAIIFSFIIINPFQKLSLFIFPIPMPAWLLGALFLFGTYYMSKRKTGDPNADRIGHEAHFWGAIFGIIYTLLLDHTLLQNLIRKIAG